MKHKLIIALVNDSLSDQVLEAARAAGASGSTIINNARGEGARPHRTFLGLELTVPTDAMLFLVEAAQADAVLTAINRTADFDGAPGNGIAFLVDVEKAVGVQRLVLAGADTALKPGD